MMKGMGKGGGKGGLAGAMGGLGGMFGGRGPKLSPSALDQMAELGAAGDMAGFPGAGRSGRRRFRWGRGLPRSRNGRRGWRDGPHRRAERRRHPGLVQVGGQGRQEGEGRRPGDAEGSLSRRRRGGADRTVLGA